MPTKVISGSLALIGFVIALLSSGIIAGNPLVVSLQRALMAMLICYLVGRVLAMVAEMAIRDEAELAVRSAMSLQDAASSPAGYDKPSPQANESEAPMAAAT